MANEVSQRYQRWFEYEKNAHAKVIQSLESVPSDQRSTPEYQKALAILAHITAGRRMWLGRLGAIPMLQGPLFPGVVELSEIVQQLHMVHEQWTAYLNQMTDEELAKTFEYQSLDAGRFRNRVEDILAQLFGHSSYHRGQIAMLVRLAGGTPAVTDLIFWCREAI
jgi:uncharacterized damage-inducible protein DinB